MFVFLSDNPRTALSSPTGARMIPILVKRPWYVFCRVSLQHRASLSHRLPRTPHLSGGALSICLNPHPTLVHTPVYCSKLCGRLPSPMDKAGMLTFELLLPQQVGKGEAYTAYGLACQTAVSCLQV